ncbi:hypothetical protein [Paraburkholderia caribensis]|uniref:hypothetical protein n=1 Tax=Paraburkholderia caribensis TaxID=75105 RepID=UPI0034D1D618
MRNIVLLGDPGSGKTHLFKSAAQAVGGRYLTVRMFLNMPANWSDEALFIDALDEKRSGRGDNDVVDEIVRKLFANPPAKVRISCRAQDWLGDSDLEAFRQYFDDHGQVTVVSLSSLTSQEQYDVLVEHGMIPTLVDEFLADVDTHGLADFRRNPQDLKMLATSVASGKWPQTRADLFVESTRLWLTEVNREHLRRDESPAEDVRAAAGALCALRLISDIDGFALDPGGREALYPDVTQIPFLDPRVASTALERRVFTGIPGVAVVDYTHRTTAEYLAAEWLAAQLEKGLSFRRLSELLGRDGHPASELRGLHAWLAVLAPGFAERLINGDPYGVLSYGDAASLSPTLRLTLLRALSELSERDPWFRYGDGNRQNERLAGLCGPEMTAEFRTILSSRTPNHSMRLLVLEVLAAGTPDPALTGDVAAIIGDDKALDAERETGLIVLLKCGPAGEAAIAQAYRHDLGWTASDFRLRAEIIAHAYQILFDARDVIALLRAAEQSDEKLRRRLYLWHLADAMPVSDIPAILDGMSAVSTEAQADESPDNESAVSHTLSLMLAKLMDSGAAIPPGDLWRWLGRLTDDRASATSYSTLRRALSARKADVLGAVAYGLENLADDQNPYLLLQRLHRLTIGALDNLELLDICADILESSSPEASGVPVVYELAIALLYSQFSERPALFERLYDFGGHGNLRARRDAMLISDIPEWRLTDAARRRKEAADMELARATQSANFTRHESDIRSGVASGWVGWLAQVYLGRFANDSHMREPRDRMAQSLDEKLVDSAETGILASLERADIPDVGAIIEASGRGSIPTWWLALVAGLDIRSRQGVRIDDLPDGLAAAALAADLVSPSSERDGNTTRHKSFEWKTALLTGKRELARNVYLQFVQTDLDAGREHVRGLYELMSMDEFAWCRTSVAMKVLGAYPNAADHHLRRLMEVVLAERSILDEFAALAGPRLSEAVLQPHAQPYWQTAAFLSRPDQFEAAFLSDAQADSALLWTLRDFGIAGQDADRALLTPMLEQVVVVAAKWFPDSPHPDNGWSGDRNAWDGAEFVKKLVNTISLDPSAAATAAFERLLKQAELATYRDYLLHAAAEQRTRRRDTEYQQPDWAQTVAALSNGDPASIGDFHALIVDTLHDVGSWIANANSNVYKRFWNEDSFGRVKDPKPEESGRDVLTDFLRDRLRTKGILVDPEGRMVQGKRADVIVAWQGFKIPVEIKRSYHADVWTAATEQLDLLYTRDPEASGYGVYVVFWFGHVAGKPMPGHPNRNVLPASATEMAMNLVDLLPVERRSRIAIVVIDTSGQPHVVAGSSAGPDA